MDSSVQEEFVLEGMIAACKVHKESYLAMKPIFGLLQEVLSDMLTPAREPVPQAAIPPHTKALPSAATSIPSAYLLERLPEEVAPDMPADKNIPVAASNLATK